MAKVTKAHFEALYDRFTEIANELADSDEDWLPAMILVNVKADGTLYQPSVMVIEGGVPNDPESKAWISKQMDVMLRRSDADIVAYASMGWSSEEARETGRPPSECADRRRIIILSMRSRTEERLGMYYVHEDTGYLEEAGLLGEGVTMAGTMTRQGWPPSKPNRA